MTTDRLKFKNPPINELVIGIFFVPILDLKAQHVGLYWAKVRERFPICEQQSVIVTSNDSAAVLLQEQPGEPVPMPRFWLTNPASPILVQIQKNAFIVNWRRGQDAIYPHYEQIYQAFRDELRSYEDFLAETLDTKIELINRCELSYINIINKSASFDKTSNIKNIIPALTGFSDLHSENRELSGMNLSVIYRIKENMFLEVSGRTGQRSDTQELVAILELKAQGAPVDLSLSNTPDWFATAHEAIYRSFLDLTAERAQRELWEPVP